MTEERSVTIDTNKFTSGRYSRIITPVLGFYVQKEGLPEGAHHYPPHYLTHKYDMNLVEEMR